jgi:hypothetical protein
VDWSASRRSGAVFLSSVDKDRAIQIGGINVFPELATRLLPFERPRRIALADQAPSGALGKAADWDADSARLVPAITEDG